MEYELLEKKKKKKNWVGGISKPNNSWSSNDWVALHASSFDPLLFFYVHGLKTKGKFEYTYTLYQPLLIFDLLANNDIINGLHKFSKTSKDSIDSCIAI